VSASPHYLSYQWRGEAEWMLSFGEKEWPQAIILSPLFEEMNFTRALVADLARNLATHRIGSWLPDLPGTGESGRSLGEIMWQDWRDATRSCCDAVAHATGATPHLVSIRGGALLADAAQGRSWWSFAPASGASLLRQLERIDRISGLKVAPQSIDIMYECAGYQLNREMRAGLAAATPLTPTVPFRIAPAELAGEGVPLWHRAEPMRDPALAAALAADIAQWVRACERR
jgi:hypothetical protein